MAADDRGLVHGGFVFGLADHAAMLAVNDPFVVLGSAEVRFLRPVVVGERLVAEARVGEVAGRKSRVRSRCGGRGAASGADESRGCAAAAAVAVGEGDEGAAAAGEDGGGGRW
jgi:acyl-coenzyme A thioesterase PaaI-like protein